MLPDPSLAQKHIPKQGPNMQAKLGNLSSKLAWIEVESEDRTRIKLKAKTESRRMPSAPIHPPNTGSREAIVCLKFLG